MNEEIMQEELSPEEAKASLGLATRLGDELLMAQAQQMAAEAPVEAQDAPGSDVAPEVEEEPEEDKSAQLEGKMDEKLEILRTELKDTLKLEIEGIRNTIKEALDEQEDWNT